MPERDAPQQPQQNGASIGSKAVKSLRRKFMAITMASLALTLIVLGVVVYQYYAWASMSRSDSIIEVLYENDGSFPPPLEERRKAIGFDFTVNIETEFENRYAWAVVNPDDSILTLDSDHIANKDSSQLYDIIEEILFSGTQRGYYDFYRYRVFSNDDGTRTVYLLDCLQREQTKVVLAQGYAVIAGACLVLVFLLLLPLSRRVTRMYERNLERQHRFVTDASHELKTPLAIISANTELTEQLTGETQWTRSTKAQVERLNALARNLIEAARSSESLDIEALPVINLSELLMRDIEDFRPLADMAGKRITANVEEDVLIRGEAESIDRMVSVLLDNAIKHGDDGGEIAVVLRKSNRKQATLRAANPAARMTEKEVRRMFDRFYRADASRSRSTGGYGIGLSAAKDNVERHGGKLTAMKENGMLVITATLPRANDE